MLLARPCENTNKKEVQPCSSEKHLSGICKALVQSPVLKKEKPTQQTRRRLGRAEVQNHPQLRIQFETAQIKTLSQKAQKKIEKRKRTRQKCLFPFLNLTSRSCHLQQEVTCSSSGWQRRQAQVWLQQLWSTCNSLKQPSVNQFQEVQWYCGV